MKKKKKRIASIKRELVAKSREAALSAISIFNDPLVTFKSETYIVLMIIAWTYLLHAYYREQGVEYRYFKQGPQRRIFVRTKHKVRHWELEHCLNHEKCPLDTDTIKNLKFLIGLRNEIEHEMTMSLDSYLDGRYQACAVNYNDYIKKLFGNKYGLDKQMVYSIQFSQLSDKQISEQKKEPDIPKRIREYINDYDNSLTDDEYNSPRYSYRMIFTRKLVNNPGKADRVYEFIDPKSPLAKEIDKAYWVKKETERPKYRPKHVVKAVQDAGFNKFRIQPEHVRMWKKEDAKNPGKGYGVNIQGTWYWYDRWIERCIELCTAAGDKYK